MKTIFGIRHMTH